MDIPMSKTNSPCTQSSSSVPSSPVTSVTGLFHNTNIHDTQPPPSPLPLSVPHDSAARDHRARVEAQEREISLAEQLSAKYKGAHQETPQRARRERGRERVEAQEELAAQEEEERVDAYGINLKKHDEFVVTLCNEIVTAVHNSIDFKKLYRKRKAVAMNCSLDKTKRAKETRIVTNINSKKSMEKSYNHAIKNIREYFNNAIIYEETSNLINKDITHSKYLEKDFENKVKERVNKKKREAEEKEEKRREREEKLRRIDEGEEISDSDNDMTHMSY